jgi:hypothetical protein
MDSGAPRGKSASRGTSAPEDVETFLAALDHPFKAEILAVRETILGADPSIGEEIKWNAPSFRTTEHFATLHLRAKGGVQVILHRGAKKRGDDGFSVDAIDDPHGMLEWLAADRATVKFRNREEMDARRIAFAGIVRQWIRYV